MTLEEKIYKELAKKYNITEKQSTDICRSVWGFVADVIERGEKEAVRLPKFGIFLCKPRRVKQLEDLNLL